MERKNYKEIYIGPLIQERVNAIHMSYAEFARQIHVARTSLYRIFESKSIDVERLLLISEILNYDFIHEVYFVGRRESIPVDIHLSLPVRNGRVFIGDLPPVLLDLLRGSQETSSNSCDVTK